MHLSRFKSSSHTTVISQSSKLHGNGFSLVWVRTWQCSWPLLLNSLSHNGQGYFLGLPCWAAWDGSNSSWRWLLRWVFLLLFEWSFLLKALWQISHFISFQIFALWSSIGVEFHNHQNYMEMASPWFVFRNDTAVAHCWEIVYRTTVKGISLAFLCSLLVEQPEMVGKAHDTKLVGLNMCGNVPQLLCAACRGSHQGQNLA